MTTRTLDPNTNEKWATGELGRSADHVGVTSEEESIQLDSDLAMKLVSIRLPIPLIEALKAIAKHHSIAYQPMIRDLLTRFATSEINEIVADMSLKMKAQTENDTSAPVEAFIDRERTKVAACG